MSRMWLMLLVLLGGFTSTAWAEDPPAAEVEEKEAAEEERFAAFEEAMEGVVLRGHYTITGAEEPAAEERYEIQGVSKLDEGDLWLFRCTIQFGENNVTLPLPLVVKWAGDTPVITLDEVTIPGLGTFSSRVVIDGDRYAGTWQHGEVGGHLYGVIEPLGD